MIFTYKFIGKKDKMSIPSLVSIQQRLKYLTTYQKDDVIISLLKEIDPDIRVVIDDILDRFLIPGNILSKPYLEFSKDGGRICRHCIIINCGGQDCGIQHKDGRYIHCVSCYETDHVDDPLEVKSPSSIHDVKLVNCRGSACRLNKSSGSGKHCIYCYPDVDYQDWLDYDMG
jgi:hypothetical protein